jgi:hypothetical protein
VLLLPEYALGKLGIGGWDAEVEESEPFKADARGASRDELTANISSAPEPRNVPSEPESAIGRTETSRRTLILVDDMLK